MALVIQAKTEMKEAIDKVREAKAVLKEVEEEKEFYEIVNGAKYCAEIASSSSEVVEEQVVADEALDVSLSDDVHPNIEE